MAYFEKIRNLVKSNFFECEEDIIDFAQKLYKAQKITLEQRNYLFDIA